MKLGFSLPVSGAWATPANQVNVAQEAERLGYHSLWVLQRLLYPVAPQNHVPRGYVRPRPLQIPHPPITIGGYGVAAVRRAATHADGFSGGNVPLDRVAPLVAEGRPSA